MPELTVRDENTARHYIDPGQPALKRAAAQEIMILADEVPECAELYGFRRNDATGLYQRDHDMRSAHEMDANEEARLALLDACNCYARVDFYFVEEVNNAQEPSNLAELCRLLAMAHRMALGSRTVYCM